MSPGPLWRAAPLRLFRSPAWLALLVFTSALLTAAWVAVPLLERLAADAALQEEVDAASQRVVADQAPVVRSSINGVVPAGADAALRDILDQLPGLSSPTVTAVSLAGGADSRRPRPVIEANGQLTNAALHYRDGAIEALEAAFPEHRDVGLWIPEDLASRLGVTIGDAVQVGLDFPGGADEQTRASAQVAGIYPTAELSRLPATGDRDTWVTERGDLPDDPARPGQGLPLLIADRDTFDNLALAIEMRPMWLADQVLVQNPTPEQAGAAAAAVLELTSAAAQQGTDVARATAEVLPTPVRMAVGSGIPDIVERAADTARLTARQAGQTAWAGIGLGLVSVATASVLLQRSRRVEGELMTGLGIKPRSVAALAGLEAVLPVLLGVTMGAAAAGAIMPFIGPPGRYGPDVVADIAQGALPAAAAALALVALAGGLTAAWRMYSGRRAESVAAKVPWEAMLVVAAVVAVLALPDQNRQTGTASLLALALPALVAAAIAVLWLRALDLVAGLWSRRRAGAPPRGWFSRSVRLAGRRSRGAGTERLVVTLTLAVGGAMLLYALAVERGLDHGIEDKVATAVGARTAVLLDDQWLLDRPDDGARFELPPAEIAGATPVWRGVVTLPPAFGQHSLMAVDSSSFADVADWGSPRMRSAGTSALAALPSGLADVPIVPVGDSAAVTQETGFMSSYLSWEVVVRPVDRLEAFPGTQVSAQSAVVADATVLFNQILEQNGNIGIEDELEAEGIMQVSAAVFERWLWSSRPAEEVVNELAALGIHPLEVVTRDEFAAHADLLSASWVLDLVTALGGSAALLAGGVLLLFAVRRADRDRVAELMLARMGSTDGELRVTRAMELSFVALRALSAALLAAGGLALLGPAVLDPAPRLPPLVRAAPAWSDLAALGVVTIVLVLVATAVARRRIRSLTTAEVLRGEE
jgi:hypothetical protein